MHMRLTYVLAASMVSAKVDAPNTILSIKCLKGQMLAVCRAGRFLQGPLIKETREIWMLTGTWEERPSNSGPKKQLDIQAHILLKNLDTKQGTLKVLPLLVRLWHCPLFHILCGLSLPNSNVVFRVWRSILTARQCIYTSSIYNFTMKGNAQNICIFA